MKIKCLTLLILITASVNCFSADHVWVSDPSLLKWQQYPDGKIYFRNLNDFPVGAYPNNFGGCCVKYWIDTATDGGKALWSTILYHIAANKPFYISKDTAAVDGHISYIGKW